MAACLLEVGWEGCWGQRVDVQTGAVVEAPSSSQKEVVVAEGGEVGLVRPVSEQALVWWLVRVQEHGSAQPAAPF